MISLGIDPGTIRTGWGVVRRDGSRIVRIDSGVIHLDEHTAIEDRLVVLHDRLNEILLSTGPDEAAVENLFFAKNASSALKLGHARGVILLCLRRHGLPVASYQPTEVKRALIGAGRAEKGQIQRVLEIILKTGRALEADEADALAVAVCHANGAGLRRPGNPLSHSHER